jgi:esterase/lipase
MENIILKSQESLKLSKVILAWHITKLITPLSREIAGLLASKIWFTPMRYKGSYRKPQTTIIQKKSRLSSFPKVEINTFTPHESLPGAVVLVHGWGGSSNQFNALIEELLKYKRTVVCFDFPAHGMTKGFSTDLWEMSEILNEVLRTISGPIDLICHSFGLLVAGQVLRNPAGDIKKIVSISSPKSFQFLLDQFFHKTRLRKELETALIKRIQNRLLKRIDVQKDVDLDHRYLQKDWLIIHDENDREIPLAEYYELKKLNPGAKCFTTKGFGHNRILCADEVISETVRFLVTFAQ